MIRTDPTVQVLALRMQLAVIRHDPEAWNVAYEHFQTIRETELEANGQSSLLWTLMFTLASCAAGATVDVEGGNEEKSARFLREVPRKVAIQ